MDAILIAANSIEQLEREVEQLKAILRDARLVIENPTEQVPGRRRTLEAIDKVL